MNTLQLSLEENNSAFSPGEEIRGSAQWQLDRQPKSIEVRLRWTTTGRGTSDFAVANHKTVDTPPAVGSTPFQFTAPAEPHSFRGHLIELVWQIELLVEPGGHIEVRPIVIAPAGKRIELKHLDNPLVPAAAIAPLVR